MPKSLARLYEWQAEMMEWCDRTFPEAPMAHKLYMVQMVFSKSQAVKDLLEGEVDKKLDMMVAIDAFIADKPLCVVLRVHYDVWASSWTFTASERMSIYTDDGSIQARCDVKSDGCIFHVPPDDNDPVESLLQTHLREAYELSLIEDPQPTVDLQLLAYDFFKEGWMRCIKQYLNPARPYVFNGIYVEAWNDNQKVFSMSTSSEDPGVEANKMCSFLELERAVRLRGASFKPHQLGYVKITPSPIKEADQ